MKEKLNWIRSGFEIDIESIEMHIELSKLAFIWIFPISEGLWILLEWFRMNSWYNLHPEFLHFCNHVQKGKNNSYSISWEVIYLLSKVAHSVKFSHRSRSDVSRNHQTFSQLTDSYFQCWFDSTYCEQKDVRINQIKQ